MRQPLKSTLFYKKRICLKINFDCQDQTWANFANVNFIILLNLHLVGWFAKFLEVQKYILQMQTNTHTQLKLSILYTTNNTNLYIQTQEYKMPKSKPPTNLIRYMYNLLHFLH